MNSSRKDEMGNETEITLSEMLAARDRRASRQRELLDVYHKPLISFTMNIAGAVKTGALIRRAFSYGEASVRKMLAAKKYPVLHFEKISERTGEEAFFVVDAPALDIKKLTVFLEDGGGTVRDLEGDIRINTVNNTDNNTDNRTGIGRLFDMDVIRENGEKVDRTELGARERSCLICGGPAKACARSRTHTVAALQKKTQEMLKAFFYRRDAKTISRNACKALLYEAATTPKPGLVDRANNGSHRDMDFYSFIDSASVLRGYFYKCACVGMEEGAKNEGEVLGKLRLQGLMAEGEMLSATGGVNTHKGAIFSTGLLCAALGSVGYDGWKTPEAILAECARLAKGITDEDFKNLTKETAATTGQKLFLDYGIRGARGQAEDGYPAVLGHGLPVLLRELAAGQTKDMAGAICMLHLLCAETDTNLVARSDKKTQEEVTEKIQALLAKNPSPQKEDIEELDREFTAKNLSPGGSADLLALCWMLYLMCNEA